MILYRPLLVTIIPLDLDEADNLMANYPFPFLITKVFS